MNSTPAFLARGRSLVAAASVLGLLSFAPPPPVGAAPATKPPARTGKPAAKPAPAGARPTARPAAAKAVDLPAGAFGEDSALAVWMDLGAITPDAVKAAEAAVKAVMPANAAGAALPGGANVDLDDVDSDQMIKFRNAAVEAGAEVLVAVSSGNLGGQAAEAGINAGGAGGGGAAGGDAAGDADADAPAPGAAGAGGAKQDGVVFFRLKEGVKPQKFTQALRATAKAQKLKAQGKEIDPEKFDVKPWSGRWVYGVGPDMAEPEGKAPAAGAAGDQIGKQFATALGRQDGAPIRFAFRMSENAGRMIKDAGQNPDVAMMQGVLGPLQSLETGSVGVWLGQQPKLSLNLTFADAQQAGQFKAATDALVGMVAGFMQVAAAQPEPGAKALNPGVVQGIVAPLMMKHNGTSLDTTFDLKFLSNIQHLTEAMPKQGGGGPGGPGGPPGGRGAPAGPGKEDDGGL